MSQGDDLFKSMQAKLDNLTNKFPQNQYYQQQMHNNHYGQQILQDVQNQQPPYGRSNILQEDQHLHYMDDSPEPEMFDQLGMNDPKEQQQQQYYYQQRPQYKQQQSQPQQHGGYSQGGQNTYYKQNYDNQHSGRSFSNGSGYNQYGQNPNGGFQGQRKPFYNKYQGQAHGSQQAPHERQYTPGARFGQRHQGGFHSTPSNQYNQQGNTQHQQGQSFQNNQEQQQQQQVQGEKIGGGNHIAGTKIFINNIEPHVNEEVILHYFESFGQINDLKVFHRNDQNYAYVIYDKYEEADKAASTPSPQPTWTVSLAKSKNTVMQFQRSTLFNQQEGNQNTYAGAKFHNNGNGAPFKKPFNKFSQNPNSNYQGNRFDRSERVGGYFGQNKFDNNGEKPFHHNHHQNHFSDGNQQEQGGEGFSNGKTQINQKILVREIWISNIDEKCKIYIKDVIEDNFGGIEDLEFFEREKDSFAFIKFFTVQTALHAFANKEKIAELLETDSVKLTYSDPSRRKNIIGDHENYMQDENLSTVLYISFPYGFKINKNVIQKIASDYGNVMNVTVKRSEDPKQTSSVLVEFKDLKDTKFAFKHMREDQEKMNPKSEYAILLNSEKFVQENNLKLKEKVKSATQQVPQQAPVNTYNNAQNQKYIQKKPFTSKTNLNSSLQEIVGIPPTKPLQSNKGRTFSPEKDIEINQKRTYNQHKQSLLNTSQEQGYNPDQTDDDFQFEDDDDPLWSGFISINKKGRCQMDAKEIQKQGPLDFENYNLVMNSKCHLSEPFRMTPYAVLIFKPSDQTAVKPFKDVKTFLNSTPTQAGVIETRYFRIFLLPNCEQATKLYPQVKEGNIVAVCHNIGNLSKKENKYDEKLQARKQAQSNDGYHDDDEEDNLVYDPSSILQDTSKPMNKYNQRHNPHHDDYQDEDIYDPNQINISKDDNKNADMSDLIDNPSLIDNMLKSIF